MKDYILNSPAFAGDRPPLWAKFDANWYRTRYAGRLRAEAEATPGAQLPDLSDEGLEHHWIATGAAQGLSPNRFFDEEWYLRQNPDVREGISLGIFECGFLHYCESGYRSRSPHWLFSEENYFRLNPDLSPHELNAQGFCNGYDHYLAVGDQEHRLSHTFFNPKVFHAASMAERHHYDFSVGDFVQFLRSSDAGRRRSSWYFNPGWYLETYPEVVKELESGRYLNPLHHYLTNGNPCAFDPNPYFSEAYYSELYPDIAVTVNSGGFRNCYEHFLRYGVNEDRQPSAGVDLAAFRNQPGMLKRLRNTQASDIFALWTMSHGKIAQNSAEQNAPIEQFLRLDLQRAQTLIPSLVRRPLDFRLTRAPEISVVIATSNQFLELLATLSALQANEPGKLQVIIVDAGSTDETSQIERFARGLHVIRPPSRTSPAEQIRLAIAQAQAGEVLVLRPGVQPFPGSIAIAARALAANPALHAVGGQTLSLDGLVEEAGTILWRDGTTTAYGKGQRANEPELSFRRPVDAITSGMLLCRRVHLRDGLVLDADCNGDREIFLAICLSLRLSGGEIGYDPDIICRSPAPTQLTENVRARSEAWVRSRFCGFLSHQMLPATNPIRARRSGAKPNVLVLCKQMPYSHLGSPHLRHRNVVLELNTLGYQVTVFPLYGQLHDPVATALDFPSDIELMDDCDLAELREFLLRRIGCFDLIWFAGIQVLQRTADILRSMPDALPRRGLVLDAHGSHAQEWHARRMVGCVDDQSILRKDLKLDLEQAWLTQCVVVGDISEKALIEPLGVPGVAILGSAPVEIPASVPNFDERKGVLLALPVHEDGDAVADGLHWFVQHVLPILDRELPSDVTIQIAGYRADNIDLTEYARSRRIEAFADENDLRSLYLSRRVLVEPSRVLVSAALEVREAAACGLPAVLNDVSAQRLSLTPGTSCLSGDYRDPRGYADSIVKLYTDRTLWMALSNGARSEMKADAATSRFRSDLQHVIDTATSLVPYSAVPSEPLTSVILEPTLAPAPIRLQPRFVQASVQAEGAPESGSGANHPKTLAPLVGITFPEEGR